MTTRSLAVKLKRLENRAKMRPGRYDAEVESAEVVLPPLEAFVVRAKSFDTKLPRCVRPEQVAHLRFVTSVETTEAS